MEKTTYVISQVVHQDFDTKLIAEEKAETSWSRAMEVYQEKISMQLKIDNPAEFAVKAIQLSRDKAQEANESDIT